MANFLDVNGLTHFYDKLKDVFAKKTDIINDVTVDGSTVVDADKVANIDTSSILNNVIEVSDSPTVGKIWVSDDTETYDTIYTKDEVDELIDNIDLSSKQDVLVSGTNIKTVNSNSLLGEGNIDISVPTKTSDLTNDSGFIDSSATVANSINWNGIVDDHATLNTTDTWVPVYNGSKLQHRVIPASIYAGLSLTTLWTNASPYSDFASQTITISGLSNYKFLLFDSVNDYSSSKFCCGIAVSGSTGFLFGVTSNHYARWRPISISGDNITFGAGAYPTATGDNGSAVPCHIYGVK